MRKIPIKITFQKLNKSYGFIVSFSGIPMFRTGI